MAYLKKIKKLSLNKLENNIHV
ncbi:MAG: hypothetical protein K0S67_1488, partial [Nitrososphaeraceae archaeon]|nr:hypothetical protein [Nitrososphaeraceae archaeon]